MHIVCVYNKGPIHVGAHSRGVTPEYAFVEKAPGIVALLNEELRERNEFEVLDDAARIAAREQSPQVRGLQVHPISRTGQRARSEQRSNSGEALPARVLRWEWDCHRVTGHDSDPLAVDTQPRSHAQTVHALWETSMRSTLGGPR